MPTKTDRARAEEHARVQAARFVSELRDAYTPHGPNGPTGTFMLVPHAGDFSDRLRTLVEDAYLQGAAGAPDRSPQLRT